MTTAAALLDGKKVSQEILDRCAARVTLIKQRTSIVPTLATVLVGEDPASVTYVRMKRNRCEAVGMTSLRVALPASTTPHPSTSTNALRSRPSRPPRMSTA
jgi:methylenetetrahydrofolate dehydrogenase (NADP+) / methenyltetrahydrofolate cyclohydrolase